VPYNSNKINNFAFAQYFADRVFRDSSPFSHDIYQINPSAKILSWAEPLDATDAAVTFQMLCSLKGKNLLVNLLWSQSRNAENNGNAPTSHYLLISCNVSMAHANVAKTKASLVKQQLTLLAIAQTPTLSPI
jgi:hypothetical protein